MSPDIFWDQYRSPITEPEEFNINGLFQEFSWIDSLPEVDDLYSAQIDELKETIREAEEAGDHQKARMYGRVIRKTENIFTERRLDELRIEEIANYFGISTED